MKLRFFIKKWLRTNKKELYEQLKEESRLGKNSKKPMRSFVSTPYLKLVEFSDKDLENMYNDYIIYAKKINSLKRIPVSLPTYRKFRGVLSSIYSAPKIEKKKSRRLPEIERIDTQPNAFHYIAPRYSRFRRIMRSGKDTGLSPQRN